MTRTVLVTGAGSGIGHAITQRLSQLDYRVIALSRLTPPFAANDRIRPVALDLSVLPSLPQALDQLFADEAIDAMISCAGSGAFAHLEEFSYAQIDAAIAVNLTQHIYLSRWLLPRLKRMGRGDLIFIGSDAALHGAKKGSLYCACKFALRGLAQSLRAECAANDIRVCIIHPGMVMSPFYDDLSFQPGAEESQHILPRDVAETVSLVLNMRPGTVLDEIHMSPQRKVIRFKKQPATE